MHLRTPWFLGIAGLLACSSTAPADDRLKVEKIAGGDNVVVVMDSRYNAAPTWWCRNDEVLRTTGELALGNVPKADGCNSEIVVFAEENAMALSSPAWTDNDGETHTITMAPIIDVPVSIWIANGAAREQAPLDIANATLIYRKNKVGVQFVATVEDLSANVKAIETIGNSCYSIGRIRRSDWYTPNTLNIYYVENISLPEELNGGRRAAGLTCDRFGDGVIKSDANIIFIAGTANLATVAHEIGHSFGLRPGFGGGHTTDKKGLTLKGFGPNNVMCTARCLATRDHFTLGQAFRMNTQADEWGGTMLIANGLRTGPGRPCPPLTTSDVCPPLALDWSRP